MATVTYAVDDPADLDIEKAVFEIYPLFEATDNAILRTEYASALADLIGSTGEFHRYVRGNSGDLQASRDRLLATFRDNIRLLVGKTWVEGHDEKRKEHTLAALDGFVGQVTGSDYPAAVRTFVKVADELAVLLFGEAPSDKGFMDYVFRIDPRLGVFYWFVGKLRDGVPPHAELARLQILVGVYALSTF